MADQEIDLEKLINPTPRQREFIEAVRDHKYVLYGGAKGGGKSYILRWTLIVYLINVYQELGIRGVRAGLFCENYPSLKDRQITKIANEFPKELGTLQDSQVQGMSFTLKEELGGGVIALRNLDDPSKYASSEFAIVAIDELSKNKREVFDQLRSIVRWPGIEQTRFIAGSNPGDIGHDWVKKIFITKQLSKGDPLPEEIAFVRSLPTDNPYNSENYLNELSRLPEKLKKAYYDGNWDVFAGQYFSEWDNQVHVCEPFEVPPTWKRFRAYDHGRDAPACCLWFALDYDGRLWCYREFYQNGMDVDQIADKINELSQGEYYEFSVADPAIFAKMGFVDRFGGQTIAETFSRHGVQFRPSSNRRVDGWNLMHQYLRWNELTRPKLIFFKTCYNAIRSIPSLVHDKHRGEDLDSKGDDHCADTARYMLSTLHEQKTPTPLNDVQRKLAQMQNEDMSLNRMYLGNAYDR